MAAARKPPYRIPLMTHNLSPKFPTRFQVGCTMEKEVRRPKKINVLGPGVPHDGDRGAAREARPRFIPTHGNPVRR